MSLNRPASEGTSGALSARHAEALLHLQSDLEFSFADYGDSG